MKTHVNELLGCVERETITGALRSRLVILDETAVLTDGEGVVHSLPAGSRLLVVDHVGVEQPVVEQYLDDGELLMHWLWSTRHHGEETRTPLDLRTPEYGGREDAEVIPF